MEELPCSAIVYRAMVRELDRSYDESRFACRVHSPSSAEG